VSDQIFSMIGLQAAHGDCLFIVAGSPEKPALFVVDGGPKGVFENSLEPGLRAFKAKFSPDDTLKLKLCMVSHIDDDHINGILKLSRKLDADGEGDFNIFDFWFNSFDETIGNMPPQLRGRSSTLAAAMSEDPMFAALSDTTRAVLASVKQGRDLRARLDALGARLNGGGGKLLMSGSDPVKFRVSQTQDVDIQVLLPAHARLKALYDKWEANIASGASLAQLAENLDESIANLSSIVALVTSGGRSMLITGDARGDDIIAGLEDAGMLDDGRLFVDVLKIQHHGSNRNIDEEFLATVRARHIVISGNGEHHNPDLDTLEMIADAYPDDPVTCHLTYGADSRLEPKPSHLTTLERLAASRPGFMANVVTPTGSQRGVQIDLAAPLEF
jgi:hypothetical protein